ncbi:hypothetical protein GCM10027594_10420 [Hymenobacter agri]
MAYAQLPTWQTALALTNSPSQIPEVKASTTDASGNIYLTGMLIGTTNFGATALTSAGNGDVFVAKWSPVTGQFVWAQRAGGSSLEVAEAIAVSGPNVYVVGYFTSPTADFGATTLTNSYQGTALSADVFVAKLSDTGPNATFTWAKRGKAQHATAVAVSGSSVYMAGYFGGTQAEFGQMVLPNSSNQYYLDSYVVKLTDTGPTGDFVWAQQVTGADTEWIFGMVANGPNIYIGGGFISAPARFGAVALSNGGQGDAFVAKLTDDGNSGRFVWAQRAGGTGTERVNAMTVRGTSVYAVGFFNSVPATFGNTALASIGSNDAFIAKLTDAGPTGNFVWAQRAGGTGTAGIGDQATAIAVSGPTLYVAGTFNGTFSDFGSTTLDSGLGSIFLTRLSDAGSTSSFDWAISGGNPQYNAVMGVVISGPRIYLTGNTSLPARFGSISINAINSFAYLASVADAQALATASSTAGPSTIALFPNPAHSVVKVHIPPVAGETQLTLTLCDALGRNVQTHKMLMPAAGLQAEFPLAGLAPGLYRVVVQASSWQAARMLAVE